jgi:CHAT domain-containing protein
MHVGMAFQSLILHSKFGRTANISDDLGETKEGLKYLTQALRVAKESGDVSYYANVLGNIGNHYVQQGYILTAIKYNKEAITLYPKYAATHKPLNSIAYPNNDPIIAPKPVQSSATTAQSNILIEEIKKQISKKSFQGETAKELFLLGLLSSIYLGNQEFKRMYEISEREIIIHQQITGNRLSESESLAKIAFILNKWDRKREAIVFYNKALDIQRQLKIRPQQAETLIALAEVYESLGAYQQSLKTYDEALDLALAVDNLDHQDSAFQGKIRVFRLMGDTKQALMIAKEKLLPLTKISGKRFSKLAALYALGNVYREKGDYRQSLDMLNSSLQQNLLGVGENDEAFRSLGLNWFGLTYQAMEDYPKAQVSFEQSIAIARKNNLPVREAAAMKNLGNVYKQQKNPQQAQKSYDQAIALLRNLKFRSEEADTLSLVATLQRSQGNLPAAQQLIEDAIKIVEDIRKDVANPELRTSFLASKQDYYKIKIGILMDLHQQQPTKGYDKQALETSERGRARGLVELLTTAGIDRQLKPKGSPILVTQIDQLERDLRVVELQRVALLNPTPEQANDLDRKSNALISQIQEIRNKLRIENPAYAALKYPEPITLREIQQKVLDKDTVMLQYSIGKEHSYLWFVTPTTVQTYTLPGEKDLEAIAKPFHSTLTNSGSINDVKRTGDKLFNLIISPVANQLAGKRLLVVADGVLQYIPFAALPLPDHNSYIPLIKNHEIVNAPSAATIALQRQQPQRTAPKTLAVIADPVFKVDDARLGSKNKASIDSCLVTPTNNSPNTTNPAELQRSLRILDLRNIQRLPNTQQEAQQILSLVPPNQREAACSFAANYETVTQPQKLQLDKYRNVVFATHGFINSSNPQLSGLVLSLVDNKGQARDGFLRLHDIFNLQLNADLVVLSACQTGLGEDIRGEGLVGLTRGFMYAGTRRVITSLWNVDDASTAQLMASLFQKTLKEQQTPVAALRSAQLQLWQTNPDPKYWAAFTLQGEWLP